ncbi:MAG TPA: NAD(P)H-dependent oxidoreductase subunit E [Acidimicrobiia bacterium]|jgi:NADH-quinone oxidoreductase subunit F
MSAVPTAQERAAVDSVLGLPESGWAGGMRRPIDGHVAFGGFHRSQDLRDQLLPVLHSVQSALGWISPGALNYVCERLIVQPAEAYGVATFYSLFATEPRPPRVAHLCDDIACKLAGADDIALLLETELGPSGSNPDSTWMPSPCLGQCDRAVAALLQLAGDDDTVLAPATAEGIVAALAGQKSPQLPPIPSPTPQTESDPGELRILRRIGVVDPESLVDYRSAGGYDALAQAITLGADAVIGEVRAANLRGRGGAAFPTGVKWEAVAAGSATPKYVVCNADESEPGTFKDRVLLEGDPFAVIEALTIAGFATGAVRGFVYIRGEYPLATHRVETAIAAARSAGLLGEDVMGAGFAFDVELRRGAGAYICGEETALFNSIEGHRGEPRQKPPFPTQAGLFGKPTVVNNVETLANVPSIVIGGGEAFAAIGTAESTGTRLFCLAGHVGTPGVYEVPFGTTLRRLVDLAGGFVGDVKAILLGGAAGSFASPEVLDLPLTFEDTSAANVSLGSGVVMPFNETTDFMAIAHRMAGFFRDESCGQCVPCRVGTVRQEEALFRLSSGTGDDTELELLRQIDQVMKDASICGLGHTAGSAIQSAIGLGLIGGAA